MMNHCEKLGILIFLEIRLKDESTKLKINEFESRFVEKSSNEQERNVLRIKSRKTEIEIEIDLNYDSKLKSKAIRRKIRMKHDPYPKIVLELIQLLAEFKTFHYRI